MFSWPPNYDFCYTISSVITREGIGLHSGEKTRVKISPYEKEGYFVSFADKPEEIFKLDQNLIGSTMLCTAVKLGGRNLYTIEHLLASLAGCGLSYIHIEVDGKEIPVLDGSAIQWIKAFEEVGIKKVHKPINFIREINESIILNKENSVIALTPSKKITIICDDIEYNLEMNDDKTILDFALENDIDAPYSCQGGICSTCLAKLDKGSVKMDNNQILTDDEIQEGYILSCQSRPTSDEVVINYDDDPNNYISTKIVMDY